MSAASKSRRILTAALASVFLLAVGIVYADLQLGYYSPENLGSVSQPAPRPEQPDAVYRVSTYSLFKPQLAPGDGRQDAGAYCNTCHTPSYITMQPPLPAATWAAEVSKMQKTFGMDIPADSQARILKYLQSHYTPETRKR